jgi:hypothetical protein
VLGLYLFDTRKRAAAIMDPSACRVVYIDERFNTERWISRDGLSPNTPTRAGSQVEFTALPPDLQMNVNAFLTVFNQGKPPTIPHSIAQADNLHSVCLQFWPSILDQVVRTPRPSQTRLHPNHRLLRRWVRRQTGPSQNSTQILPILRLSSALTEPTAKRNHLLVRV